jgi:hypothetical protein
MNDEYNFLSKPLTTSAFIQGMNFQPSGMEYVMPDSYEAFKPVDVMKNLQPTVLATEVGQDVLKSVSNDVASAATSGIKDAGKDIAGSGADKNGGFFSNLFDDGDKIAGLGSLVGGVAGLAGTLANLPLLREQRRSLAQNRAFAAEDQLARRTARRGFNSLNA